MAACAWPREDTRWRSPRCTSSVARKLACRVTQSRKRRAPLEGLIFVSDRSIIQRKSCLHRFSWRLGCRDAEEAFPSPLCSFVATRTANTVALLEHFPRPSWALPQPADVGPLIL